MNNKLFKLVILVILNLSLIACSTKKNEPEYLFELYLEKLRESEVNTNLTSTFTDLNELITNYPGTKFANYSKLRLAELSYKNLSTFINASEDLVLSEQYLRSFLQVNADHPLEPYIYSKLVQINYIRSIEGIFVSGTNAEPLYDTIQIFNNFKLLYPVNYYFPEISYYANLASKKLAEYEHNIADWYYNRKLYNAAINRYIFVLENFPEYDKLEQLAQSLILAYEKNLNFDAAKKYEELYKEIYTN